MSDRLLVISQQYPPEMGGNASRVGDTARYLAADGWDVTVLAPPKTFPLGTYDRTSARHTTATDHGVEVHRLWTWQPSTSDPGFASRLAYYLVFAFHATLWTLANRTRFDAMLCATPPIFTTIPALVVGTIAKVPWAVDVGDLWIDAATSLGFIAEGSLSTRLSRRYERLVYRRADRLFTTTEEMNRALVRRYGGSLEPKLAIVPAAVETDRFAADRDDDGRTIIYTGNVGHAQGLDASIRAMQSVQADARLLIVGDGDVRPDLEGLVADLGLSDRVAFRDPVDREAVPGLLQTASVGLATLRPSEGLEYAVPTKACEYMAAGLPLVTTGYGALTALVRDADAGIAVEDADPEALAAAFDRLLADPDERERYGRNGRETVSTRFDRRRIGQRLSEELQDIVEAHTHP